ncbi:outer membrane autotransporter barrel domain-containing protein [Bartonella elizabethae F9251 = ATCC 49927]|uniref:Outer membrane autotransporter barrel domain-containing protein n=1 Tax=Bartonella elizabethae F9251 = ATCC 49927 TaxID=1094555 RepID=J0R942_BAREL|nr:autotransporter outer membrane beta-barrel domain-containing protein [Bartonella elizabethae]EJF92264.1 outer membrane autotransporter barrel domain-containing protein [Bartonella elizabethae F9251 = ATCC 49927]
MSKKILLSYTAISAILLFGTYPNAQAKELRVSGGKKIEVSKESYNNIWAEKGGKIIGKNLKLGSTPPEGTSFVATIVVVKGSDSLIELSENTIVGAPLGNDPFYGYGVQVSDNATFKMTGGSINVSASGVALFNSSSVLENVTIASCYNKYDNVLIWGIDANGKSKLTLKNVTIKEAMYGVRAKKNSQVTVSGGSFGGRIHAESGSTIILKDNVEVTSFKGENPGADVHEYEPGDGLYASDSQSKITMTGGKVTANGSAFVLKDGGKIDTINISAKAERSGIRFEDSPNDKTSEINLTDTKLLVEKGVGINTNESIGKVNLKNSKILADTLFKNDIQETEPVEMFTLTADHSVLQGGVRNKEKGKTSFDLKNETTWTLKISENEKDAEGKLLDIAQRARSDISVLGLNNSSIIFDKPTEGHYQTLHIGSGKPETKAVYNATGDAKIYFNTKWTDGTPITEQETDHLLIHGDVSGSTTVYIQSDLGDKESVINASDPSNIGGLSLIQVSGKADENSFKLAHGYITRGGSPYKYTLTGYGPESSYGQANIEQSLFDEKNENFWDFRLHKELLPDSKAEAPVAQMASYLVMPNALFYSGLTDMAEQNALLANIRTSVVDKGQEKQNGFFLHTYGSTGTFSSESAPRQYGYSGADLRYAALQGGVNFATLEGHNTTTRFGLIGTYGQLSFTPKDMQDAGKNTVDKWSLTAYGTIQYDNGFYLDTLLSYGFLKGEITNALIGTTAKLKNAKMLNISTTVGKQFATGIQGVTFEPQAQVAYQHLAFDTILDADNLTIDMQNPHQWMIRVGGRLTKNITTENNRPMSFYGKVNLIKTLGDDQALHIDKDYKLDAMGSALEGGLGINAQLSTNLSLHGDVSYQQKLQKTGISGASFSGGIRYQF